MTQFAVTVVSHDRPGLIADVTGVLAGLGGNLESSSMSLLQGHFAWTLIVDVDADPLSVRSLLLDVCPSGVTVLTLDPQLQAQTPIATRLIVSLHGGDAIGLVAAVTRALADAGGNIVQLTTDLSNGMYIGAAEVEFAQSIDTVALTAQLQHLGKELGVKVSVQSAEADLL